MNNANYFIKNLDMNKHPEGGYYKECFNSLQNVNIDSKDKKLWTSIYFLLEENEVSNFHKLESDEMWYYHSGSPLTIYMIDEDGNLITKQLGLDIENNESPQVLVKKGCIFGSSMNEEGYSLVGCMVSPGFTFDEFKLYKRDELLSLHPQHKDIITKLTRD